MRISESMTHTLVSKIDLMHRRYQLAQEGIFDEDDWKETNIGFSFEWLFGNRFSRLWWEHAGRSAYSNVPELVEYVDSRIKSVSEDIDLPALTGPVVELV